MYHTRNGLDELDEKKKQPLVGSITRVFQGNMGDYKGTIVACKSGTYSRSSNAKFMATVIPSLNQSPCFSNLHIPVDCIGDWLGLTRATVNLVMFFIPIPPLGTQP